jgi:hypothetical protein
MPRRYDHVKMQFIPKVPSGGIEQPIKFPAYIQSIDDSYSPTWDAMKDMGRADAKYMYSQFNRNVNISFFIVILKRSERELWLNALNSLLACTYPVYGSELGYNGIFLGFQIGNLLQSTGYIENITYSIDNNSPWTDGIPVVYNVNMSINVLEDKKPKYKRQSHRPIMGTPGYGRGDN